MDDSQPLPILTHVKSHRLRGPRPCSWISSSSDSSFNEHQDIWCEGRSTASSESSDSSISSSSSSPVNTPKSLVEFGEKSCSRHAHRRKPAGPRAPRDSSCFDVRPALLIKTSLPAVPRFQREISPATPLLQSAHILQSPQIPPFSINSPTNFLLDWDAIFKILGCADAPPESAGS